ncbi:MAG: hypothetical protein CK532_04145 [Flavobacteriales bacterium]|nr:MAG: hypothetical protein CK532_04145 [Flavobacteriales bacterium]
MGSMIVFSACYYDNKKEMYGSSVTCDTSNVNYTSVIKPLIDQNCIGCHGSSATVSLQTYDLVKAQTLAGKIEGTMNESGTYSLMPPGGKLSSCKLGQVNKWIRNGMPL